MSDRFRLTLAQLNATVGDIDGNAEKARQAWRAGRDAGAVVASDTSSAAIRSSSAATRA